MNIDDIANSPLREEDATAGAVGCPPHVPSRLYEWPESILRVAPEMKGYWATCANCGTDYKVKK